MILAVTTVTVAGLIVVPAIGLVGVLLDLRDAYNDLWRMRVSQYAGELEETQALHEVRGQIARAGGLAVIVLMAVLELTGVLDGTWLVVLIYVLTIIGVVDAWRARFARKKMVRQWRRQNSERSSPYGGGTHGE